MQIQSRPSVRVAGAAGRRTLVVRASLNGSGPSVPSRPGGGSSRFAMSSDSDDAVPSDAEGDVPTIAMRPSGGAFRGLPTPTPGTAGEVGITSFSRPGGGGARFNMPAPASPQAPSGPSSPVDMPSRFSRPSGGGSRVPPSGLGPNDGGSGGAGGSGGGSGGSGGAGGAGGGAGGEEPLGFSSLAPWALAYAALCGGLYWVHQTYVAKPKPKACCGCSGKKAAAGAAAPAAAADKDKKEDKKGKK